MYLVSYLRLSNSSSLFFCEQYGDHRDLHYPLRRQRQMCIRDSINAEYMGRYNFEIPSIIFNQEEENYEKKKLYYEKNTIAAFDHLRIQIQNLQYYNITKTVVPELLKLI
eukprot:TRINITY_DN42536_c0_g1_i1.p3 TRINITY_DN42536_c0_g1~~TRINITY_DN42536_c0_g1_i1.p3  ORF type:complete len:110 (+),score=19.31 TRINITY_DN42536_c0_g1_i1:53-382(+)